MDRILTILLLCLTFTAAAQKNAAVCEVELKGHEYALHLVELGDNLFRISQKYNSTVEDIWQVNPSIVDNTIIPGQVIKVPKDSKNRSLTPAEGGEVMKSDANPKPRLKPIDPAQSVLHEVSPGQTLFAISRLYSVTVEELKEWNQLEGFAIQVGQQLIVSPFGELKVFDEATAEVTSYQPSATPIRREVNVNTRQDLLNQKYLEESGGGKKAQKERGAAEKLITNNPEMQTVYYALHKTAPVGAVMKVTNLVNRKYVFVTVLAPLPAIPENENVQVKLSPAATKDLVLLDGRSLVEIAYYK